MAGSIEKRGENTYRLIVSGGKNLDGSRCRKTKTIHSTRNDAEIALAEFITEVNRVMVPEGKSITFEDFFHIWKEKYGSKELAPKTYSRYLGMLKTRILPYLGSFALDKIKPTDLMNLYDMLENDTQIKNISKNNGQRTLKPLSPKTILEHHRLLSAMFQRAVYWQLLVNNPARRVKPPKTKKPKIEFFDDDECKLLINSLQDFSGNKLKYKVAILLDIFSGVRLGELMGLEWSDIDFTNGIVSINKSSQYLADKGVFTKTPKTESSIRDVAIPDFVVSLLEEYKLWYEEQKSIYGKLWIDSDRLFVQSDGKPMHPSTISKWFVKFVKEIGLPVINFHGLRHTNATLLILQNINVTVVAARLGHAQITTTFNFYVHPIISHKKSAGNVLQNLLIPN